MKRMFFLLTFLPQILGAEVLVWNANDPDDQVAFYHVFQKIELGGYSLLGTVMVGNQLAFTPKPAAEYSFYVTAIDIYGFESNPSNVLTYTKRPILKISKLLQFGQIKLTLTADVFKGMKYAIEGTQNFTNWSEVDAGVTSSDTLSVSFNPVFPFAFYRLKKAPTVTTARERPHELLKSVEPQMPPLDYRDPTRWQKIRWALRYRGSQHVDFKKGAEKMMERPTVFIPPSPPMPPRVVE